MSADSNAGAESLPMAALAQVHIVCDDFKESLRAGAAPRIEDYIERLGGESNTRSALFLALMEVELKHRRARDAAPLDCGIHCKVSGARDIGSGRLRRLANKHRSRSQER